jgi:hypothetical protein
MKCLLVNHGRIGGMKDIDDLARVPYDEAFVIDFDAIFRHHFNFKLYNELSKYVEFTLMALPDTENDLMDIIISGASRVVIGDDLNVRTIQKFLDMTEEIVMKCSTEQKVIMFHSLTGNMYMSCRTYDVPGVFFYYGPFSQQSPNVIPLEGFPDELKNDC